MLRLRDIYQLVRNFLFNSVNKEFLIFLFFLLVSGTFWFIMTINETYEQEIPVPLQMTNVPENVVLTTELEDTMHVTVRDKGYVLLAYLWGEPLKPLPVDFKAYGNNKTGKGSVPLADLYRQLYPSLFSSTKIISTKPERLEFYFNYGQSKRVPVKLVGQIAPANNYYLSLTRIMPETVLIYASRQILDSIDYVQTENVKMVNFSDSLIEEVSLKERRGVKMLPEKVKVALYTDIQTEESMEIPITAINMPEGRVLRTFPSKVKVRFVVGAKKFRQIRSEQFRVVADYKEISTHPTEKCNLYLRMAPQAVSKVRMEISQADYLIEQQ